MDSSFALYICLFIAAILLAFAIGYWKRKKYLSVLYMMGTIFVIYAIWPKLSNDPGFQNMLFQVKNFKLP